MPPATLHALEPADDACAHAWQRSGRHPHGYLQPLVGPLGRVVADVSVDPATASSAGADEIPAGAARAEAVAVLLRRAGHEVEWGDPGPPVSAREIERFAYERGRSSVDIVRAGPALVTELQIGAWFNAGVRRRLIRRLLVRSPRIASLARFAVPRPAASVLAVDVWFWAGVRSRATRREWHRLTRSSYVVLCYHQVSTEPVASDYDVVVTPTTFRSQLRLLGRLGYEPLTAQDVIDLHTDPEARLGRRRYLLTADDGYRDAIEALEEAERARPLAFVVTSVAAGETVGDGSAAVGDWASLRRASRAGVTVAAHGRRHVPLVECGDSELADELRGARDDLAAAGFQPPVAVAYPYGLHDRRVRQAAIDAGYALAFTTQPGKNGCGTDPWCLRRITVHGRDGLAAFLWKAVTGEALPDTIDRRHRRRAARASSVPSQ